MISVIVPVFNVEPYIHQCLDSILNQTYRDLEILLIDDGSSDRCGEICDEYERQDNRVRVFHTTNNGVSAARNLGLQESNGEYIGFVDSDDWIELNMYKILLESLEESGADISICGVYWNNKECTSNDKQNQIIYNGTESLFALIDQKINSYTWNKLYRKEIISNVLFPIGKNYEDVAIMHLVFGHVKRVVVNSIPLYHYRNTIGSIVHVYTAQNLIDYADAHLSRYHFIKNEEKDIFSLKEEEVLAHAARGISKVWRWWYVCSNYEKQMYHRKIQELNTFSKGHFPFWGYKSWPVFLRVSTMFMHSKSKASFFLLYWLNQLFRVIKPNRSNTIQNS